MEKERDTDESGDDPHRQLGGLHHGSGGHIGAKQ